MSKLKKALEKAKQSRASEETPQVTGFEDFGTDSVSGRSRAADPVSEEINPRYSQTKVVRVDTRLLKGNRLVSLFHDDVVSDQVKLLRTQVLNRLEETGGRSLMVVSPHPGEGKTFTAINLAISISLELDHTVLLVDTNLRTPSIHRFFGLNASRGLADFLMREAEIPDLLVNPGIDKLVLLPAGRALPNSAELLGAPRMAGLVEEMSRRYPDRFVIYDTAPLLRAADALTLSTLIDGILLVAEAERTTKKDLERACKLLEGRRLIGTVLNKARD